MRWAKKSGVGTNVRGSYCPENLVTAVPSRLTGIVNNRRANHSITGCLAAAFQVILVVSPPGTRRSNIMKYSNGTVNRLMSKDATSPAISDNARP